MLKSVHLVGEDEDDLYGGFNEYNPAFDTEVRDVKFIGFVFRDFNLNNYVIIASVAYNW